MRSTSRGSLIYITYDGILEPLGQSQVLAYLERLCEDWDVHLVSFEKQTPREDSHFACEMRRRLLKSGISWTPLHYHKRPSVVSTAYDILIGTLVAINIARRHSISFVHARSYVPAMIAFAVEKIMGIKFIFDMRGFWADERIEAGLWQPESSIYKLTKAQERRFLQQAEHVVTLTHAAAREVASFPFLKEGGKISVIPTCTDLDRFCPSTGDNPRAGFTLGYFGSVGLGHAFEEALVFFKTVRERRPDARLLIVNRNEHDAIRKAMQRSGIMPSHWELLTSDYCDMPACVRKITAGIALYRKSYSAIGRSPTRVGEYLACGLPCVSNVGIGDIGKLLEDKRVGVILRDFTPESYASAANSLLSLVGEAGIRERCVTAARESFSLDRGVDAYARIYTLTRAETGCRVA